jgi:peptidoglycan biosynthesis protein MviN/MurJ (putative lipid II flippase)
MVGQNLGANQPERTEKSVWRTGYFNMIFMGSVMIIFFTFGNNIASYFSEEKEVVNNAAECLRIFAMGYLFYALGMVLVQSFNGAGDTRTPTFMNLFIFWMFQIPLAYTLAILLNVGPTGVYYSIVAAESAFSIVGLRRRARRATRTPDRCVGRTARDPNGFLCFFHSWRWEIREAIGDQAPCPKATEARARSRTTDMPGTCTKRNRDVVIPHLRE